MAPPETEPADAIDVFISYAREDRQVVDALAARLMGNGHSVWYDPRIGLGAPFGSEINARLNAARCVIVVWSSSAVKSWWVWAEAAKGDKRGVLVPAALCPLDELPVPFNALHTAHLPEQLDELLERVAAQTTESGKTLEDATC